MDGSGPREEIAHVDPPLVSLCRKCSNCGQTGHNSRTCLETREPAVSEAEHKSATVDSITIQASQGQTEQASERAALDDDAAEASECSRETFRDAKKKGVAWTEEEHKLFLKGLQKLGKGDWRGISRQFVQSRSPTQVASHAQKYFIRQSVVGKRKRRSSLFDLVPEGMQDSCDLERSQASAISKQVIPSMSQTSHPSPSLPSDYPQLPPNGPEAFAFACWYHSMLMQQGSMAWVQALYDQASGAPFGTANVPAGAAFTDAQASSGAPQLGDATLRERQMAAHMAAQQQAAVLMAQQQMTAAVAMGALPSVPTFAAGKPMFDGRSESTEEVWHHGIAPTNEARSDSATEPLRPKAMQPDQCLKSRAGKERQAENAELPPEVFDNGKLVRPKAHRAQSVHSAGGLPSYLLPSQSEGATQLTTSSKDSQDSLARMYGMSSAGEPGSHNGGFGSVSGFSRTAFDKGVSSKASKMLNRAGAD